MDSTINPLVILLIAISCFLISLIIFMPIHSCIRIFKNLYHEKHYAAASIVPIYSGYKAAEYTLGKKFGYVGAMLDAALIICYFLLDHLPYGTIPAFGIIGLVLFVFNMWFCVMMFSRITKSTRLIALSVLPFLSAIGVIAIAYSKKSKYIGPAWSIDREAEDNDEDDDKEEG